MFSYMLVLVASTAGLTVGELKQLAGREYIYIQLINKSDMAWIDILRAFGYLVEIDPETSGT